MNLAELSQIAQTLGSVAVIASLIFVGWQTRQNTKAAHAASHHAVSEALNRLNILWARDSEVTRIWLAGVSDRRALSLEEQWRFDSIMRAYLHVCETMYQQADLGTGDLGIVMAEEKGIRTVFASDGVREWWVGNPYGFSHGFRDYVEKLIGFD
jgi:hypothetical protein